MKKTPNQIREELRRQLAKQHNDEIENLKKLKSQYWEKYAEADKERCRLGKENTELKEKIKQLEDWNRRLLEFMDMSEEDRRAAIQEMKENAEFQEMKENAELNDLLTTYVEKFTSMYGGIFC